MERWLEKISVSIQNKDTATNRSVSKQLGNRTGPSPRTSFKLNYKVQNSNFAIPSDVVSSHVVLFLFF